MMISFFYKIKKREVMIMSELAYVLSPVTVMFNISSCLVSICSIIWIAKQAFVLVHYIYDLNKRLDEVDSIISEKKQS